MGVVSGCIACYPFDDGHAMRFDSRSEWARMRYRLLAPRLTTSSSTSLMVVMDKSDGTASSSGGSGAGLELSLSPCDAGSSGSGDIDVFCDESPPPQDTRNTMSGCTSRVVRVLPGSMICTATRGRGGADNVISATKRWL